MAGSATRLGKQRLLLFGTLLFMIGTIIVITTGSLAGLMAGRFVQGVGTAGFVPLCIAIITERFPPGERGRVMGAWNSVIPLAGLSLPFVAGLLVEHSWLASHLSAHSDCRAVLAFVMIRRNIQPLTKRIDIHFLRSFDWIGVVLLSSALASLLFYTSSRPITGIPALQDLRLAVGMAAALWRADRLGTTSSASLHNLNIFTNCDIQPVVSLRRVTYVSDDQHQLSHTTLHERHPSSPASVIGIVLTLQAGMLFLTARAGGQLADRWGSRIPVTVSMAGLIGIMILLGSLPASTPLWLIIRGGHGARVAHRPVARPTTSGGHAAHR